MIEAIINYAFGLFVVAALVYLVIWLFYENSLKAIELEEKAAQPLVSLLAINMRVIRRFSKSHLVAGFVYQVAFLFMLATIPGFIVLMVLGYVQKQL